MSKKSILCHNGHHVHRFYKSNSASTLKITRRFSGLTKENLEAFCDISLAKDKETENLLNSARNGDAESAYRLGVLLHKQYQSMHAPITPKIQDINQSAAAQVFKEIKEETAAARKAKKGRLQQKSSIVSPVSKSSAQDRWEYWIRRSAETGHPSALVYLGNLLLHGKIDSIKGGADNINEAVECYEAAANSQPPHADALFNLGTLYFSGAEDKSGKTTIQADIDRSFGYFTRAADLGDAGAQFWVGHCLLSGEGGNIAVDVQRGLSLLHKASQKGHPAALYYLATAYRSGIPADTLGNSLAADRALFLSHLERAVAVQDGDALFCMADMYLQGFEGFPVDERKALFYLELAAEQQHADAITTLGAMHYSGRGGLTADKRKAFELYNRAGELGSQEAWKNLASMHFTGDGVPKSEEIAREILKHLREQTSDK